MGLYKGFTNVQMRKPERSMFDLSHEKKLTGRMGKLIPVFISETLPNDTFKVNTEVLLRFAPLLAPVYHRINLFVHFFFVPNRLLHADWEKFITNGRLGTDVSPVPPYVEFGDVLEAGLNTLGTSSLADYLGIRPISDVNPATSWYGKHGLNLMPFAAYYKCWYDYYRDRNYVDDNEYLPLPSGRMEMGDPEQDILFLKTRAKQHDYLTSALPWTQRGDEVLIPMEASVTYMQQSIVKRADTGATLTNYDLLLGTQTTPTYAPGSLGFTNDVGATEQTAARIENIDAIENSTITINDLRQAIRLQEWLEKNAVAGSRYNESIMAHFARKTSDGRLQRAEYLGGGRVPVQISEVLTTAWSNDGTETVPPANMAGRASTYGTKNYFRYNCEEHGFVVGIMSVMPVTGYQSGIPRMFLSRDTFLDYPWPSFAHLGEQEVYKYEAYLNATNVPNEGAEPGIFGYQSRYADWKYMQNSVHGDFRSSLDFWTLDEKYSGTPVLGNDFVLYDDDLSDRIFAVADVDHLWCYIHNKVSVVRSLPYFGTPRL